MIQDELVPMNESIFCECNQTIYINERSDSGQIY